MKRISASLISSILNEYECPYKIKAVAIDKTHRSEPTKPMLNGLFFEEQVLGVKPGKSPVSVPTLKNGKDSTDTKRIKEQAKKVLNEIFPQYEIDLKSTSSEGFRRFEIDFVEDGIQLVGEFDLLCELNDPDNGKVDAIVDLKLTKSINYENIKQGGWSWRYPHNRDHTQAYMYVYAYKLLTGKNASFYYLVCDYKTSPEYKFFRKKVGPAEFHELKQRILETSNLMDEYDSMEGGWPLNPSYDTCRYCPLRDTCKSAITKPPINEI